MTQTHISQTTPEVDSLTTWTGVGSSTADDAFSAGVAAAEAAARGADAALFVAFVGHERDHEATLAGIASVAGRDASIIGCTTCGEIAAGGPADGSVVVMALGGSGVSVASRSADVVSGDLRTAGEQVADALWDVPDRGHTVLLLLSDGLAGDQQDVVRGAYATAGATIPIVGGCAADGMAMQRTTVFQATRQGGRIGNDQVVAAAISSTSPIGVGVGSGWDSSETTATVSRAFGTVMHEIDGEPALDAYLSLLDASAMLERDASELQEFVMAHPIEIVREDNEEVRFVLSVDPEQRTVTTISAVPQGSTIRTMSGTAGSLLAAADSACSQALEQLDGPPVGVLAFDCVARRGIIGDDGLREEVRRIEDRVGAPVAGFFTYGEFARVSGASGLHNQSLVTLAFG